LNVTPQPPDPAGLRLVSLEPRGSNVRFLPSFVLAGFDRPATYQESILPSAVERIRQRELPNETLHDSVTIGRVSLKPTSEPEEGKVWGVATWINVDPRTDYFSVFVQGLTNGYRLVDAAGNQQRHQRTLRLNFWRPGDAIDPDADSIQFGIPFVDDAAEQAAILETYGVEERLDYLWEYR
jgi:hypothetical protein